MNGCMLLVLLVLAGQIGLSGPTGSMGSPGLGSPGLGSPSLGSPGIGLPGAGMPNPGLGAGAARPQTREPQREYGWQIYRESENGPQRLEYIVQISLDKAQRMAAENREFESFIDPEVAARVSRVVVTIGTEPIISAPMEEVMQVEPVTRAVMANNVQDEVGRGRYADLESSRVPDVQNVSSGAPPMTLPAGGLQTNLNDTAPAGTGSSTLAERLAQAARDPSSLLAQNGAGAGSGFLDSTRGQGTNGLRTPAFPTAPNTGIAPATLPNGTTGNQFPTSTAPPANPNANLGSNFPAPGHAGNNTNLPSTTNHNGGYNTGPAYPGTNLGNNTGTNYTNTPNLNSTLANQGKFGTIPLGTGQQPFNNSNNQAGQYGNNGFNGTGMYNAPFGYNNGQGNGGYSGPNYNGTNFTSATAPSYANNDPPSVRLAQQGLPSTTSLGATSGFDTRPLQQQQQQRNDESRSHGAGVGTNVALNQGLNGYGNPLDPTRSGMDNVVPVMFVLSLVVNFYLGMLIRKLLGRYRTLLASVRSQTV